jgi:hypothetical protein
MSAEKTYMKIGLDSLFMIKHPVAAALKAYGQGITAPYTMARFTGHPACLIKTLVGTSHLNTMVLAALHLALEVMRQPQATTWA